MKKGGPRGRAAPVSARIATLERDARVQLNQSRRSVCPRKEELKAGDYVVASLLADNTLQLRGEDGSVQRHAEEDRRCEVAIWEVNF